MHSGAMLSVLRIVAGLLFLQHGMQKLLHFPPLADPTKAVALNSLPGYAGFVELICGLLIAIGLFTRSAAFLASGTMAVAYWFFHFALASPFPIVNQGELAILYCFVFLYLVFAGPGPWSIDAARARPPRP